MIDFDAAEADVFVEFAFGGETHKIRKMKALTPEFVRDCGDLSTKSATDMMSRIIEIDGGDPTVFDRMPFYASERIWKDVQEDVTLGE